MGFEVLHQKISNGRWESAQEWLQSEDGPRMARSEFAGDLPIHMACHAIAPAAFLLALIDANPDGLRTRGTGGSLPLHIAIEKGLPLNVSIAIIKAFPDAIEIEDEAGKKPSDYLTDDSDEGLHAAVNRPVACWNANIARIASCTDRDELIAKVEQQLQDIQARLEQRSQVNQALMELMIVLKPELDKSTKVRSERLADLRGRIEKLTAEVDAYVQRAHIRIDEVERMVKAKKERWLEDKTSELRNQNEWFTLYKDLEGSLEELRVQSSELRAFKGMQ